MCTVLQTAGAPFSGDMKKLNDMVALRNSHCYATRSGVRHGKTRRMKPGAQQLTVCDLAKGPRLTSVLPAAPGIESWTSECSPLSPVLKHAQSMNSTTPLSLE